MKNILVVIDNLQEKHKAFDRAIHFAKVTGAKVHLAFLYYDNLTWLSDAEDDPLLVKAQQQAKEQHTTWWKKYIDDNKQGMDVSLEVVCEKYCANWVITHCEHNNYDIVIKEGHRTESMIHTPTDWHLLRNCPFPVYLASPEHPRKNKCILAALDLGTKSLEKHKLNEKVLETAFQLAIVENCELKCCYSIQIPTLIKDLDLIDIYAHTQKHEKEALANFSSMMDKFSIETKNVLIKEGVSWKVIAQLGQEVEASCIVIGSTHKTGIAGRFIGNTSEKVIHVAKRDILVVGE